MRLLGLLTAIISIGAVFINYNIAIFILGISMALFGINNLQLKNKTEAYIYLSAGIVFSGGICIKGILTIVI
ncbi:hypothetical protein [Sutcliffiella halmapala]|uniref:hypothetical protein n=1 Tax=Sutcliffiella halmapala TaxID=79882 RepID=UPI000994DC07|nr:hypothetical protein [Sutcliffiella halmapala]